MTRFKCWFHFTSSYYMNKRENENHASRIGSETHSTGKFLVKTSENV